MLCPVQGVVGQPEEVRACDSDPSRNEAVDVLTGFTGARTAAGSRPARSWGVLDRGVFADDDEFVPPMRQTVSLASAEARTRRAVRTSAASPTSCPRVSPKKVVAKPELD